jgi:hypothetical protein
MALPALAEKRHNVIEHVSFTRDVQVKTLGNPVDPPTMFRLGSNNAQAVTLKLLDNCGVILKAASLEAVQEKNGVAVLGGDQRLEQMAWVPSDFCVRPLSRSIWHENVT